MSTLNERNTFMSLEHWVNDSDSHGALGEWFWQ